MQNININNISEMLSKDERILLIELAKNKTTNFTTLENNLKWEYAKISRNVLWLENKQIVKIFTKKTESYVLTKRGEEVITKGLPERRLFDYLLKNKNISLKSVGDIGLNEAECNIAIGILKKYNIINIENNMGAILIKLKSSDDSRIKAIEKLINLIKDNIKIDENKVKEVKEVLNRLVEKKIIDDKEIVMTDIGKKVYQIIKSENIDTIEIITSEILKNNSWKYKKFRKYDIKAPVPPMQLGRYHPLVNVMNMVMDAFIAMGFEEMEGPWVETAFWDMDSMFIPQDHPARDVQDTFYLNKYGKLPNAELVKKVKEIQENGYDTGSVGYQNKWDEETAKELLLRTHSTPSTFKSLYKGVNNPTKMFSIGRVFRNENLDKTHLAEFHQIEGFVLADDLNLRNLMGYLKEFYSLLGIKNIKFKPTYNPYTEPSMEVLYYHTHFKKWVEIANSGIFRPEALRPYNINANVLGWGLALERLAMIIYDIKDIREILGHECKIDFIQNYHYPKL
ncbi:MAG: phenylalanine--tRNA ligase subunit alpha [Candidatus Marsarchaeota archaeon]|nr:phenylalanine--tRNA ligase subunit alpha [Candidatus Marsarchaeota archaeon]